ncbi:XRE family transcriptional regulator [Cytophagaceae bacterium YF14B1]|uniref:XRE family transcriptional regulator n=1 Tax=Xanthocytophaga flava TaxID=3048013 RepID=A0AAE3QVV6_9BACT|nr:XRE family transcriptional regulator [Xanthocytophaga flavus]MDJ1484363.1 XRE family transcriptional regulator [Xanthocytophaga flavus]
MNSQIFVRIGKKIREIRNQQQIKLHELAEESQISKGLLSRIENGRTIPSLPVLLSIVRSLKINLDVFFEGLDLHEQQKYILRRKSEYTPFEKEEGFGFLYHSILTSSIPSATIEAVILDLQPGSQRDQVITDGYEFKYLLKGEIEYHLGDEVVVMQEGDSLFFNGKIPHVPVNRTTLPASILVIYLLLPAGTNGN